MRNLFKKLVLLIVFCISLSLSKAQVNQSILDNPSYGIFGAVGFNFYNADFQILENIATCCPHFENGQGIGPNFGLIYELPLSDKLFLDLRLGYFSRSGVLKSNENRWVSVDGEAVLGDFEHKIDATLNTIAFEPMIGYKFWDNLNFEFGFNLGYSITNTFTQVETLISPAGITYENGKTTRLDTAATIPNINSFVFGINTGFSYDISLNTKNTWYLTPEVFYNYEFNKVTANTQWKISSLKVGLALKYSPRVEKETFIETPKVEPQNLFASVKAYGVEADGKEMDILKLRVEEFQSRRYKPLLPYLFFDDNSYKLDDKYSKINNSDSQKFKVEDLNQLGTLETYYHVLNIIGKRMIENPKANINVTGCNNNLGAEKNNKELSFRRAEVVKNYLINVWGIDTMRIKMGVRNLPQEPSNNNEKEGVEENRRVEISSDTYEITAPILTYDTLRVANPPMVRFKTQSGSLNGISNWSIPTSQQGTNVKTYEGKNTPPESVEWAFEQDEKSIPKRPVPLDYSISVTDKEGKTYNSPSQSIPLELITIEKKRRERIADKFIDRYSLILFSFDNAELDPDYDKVIEIIKGNLKPNSVVKIIGHTDKTGDDNLNLKLSQNRATSVLKAIKFKNSETKGEGDSLQLYNNDLPEGRFYCRRVDVVVETPVE